MLYVRYCRYTSVFGVVMYVNVFRWACTAKPKANGGGADNSNGNAATAKSRRWARPCPLRSPHCSPAEKTRQRPTAEILVTITERYRPTLPIESSTLRCGAVARNNVTVTIAKTAATANFLRATNAAETSTWTISAPPATLTVAQKVWPRWLSRSVSTIAFYILSVLCINVLPNVEKKNQQNSHKAHSPAASKKPEHTRALVSLWPTIITVIGCDRFFYKTSEF